MQYLVCKQVITEYNFLCYFFVSHGYIYEKCRNVDDVVTCMNKKNIYKAQERQTQDIKIYH